MRWTDLPADREPGDDGDSPVPRRGDWEDLRRRLERLPPGHPSAPDGDDEADDADERDTGQIEPDADRDGREADRGRPGRPDGRGGHDARSGPGAAAGGQREPYRPWFTAGESPEPWFNADSEG